MITKETFCKALQMIHEQEEINRKVSESLTMIGDGYFIYGPKNKFLEALLLVMKETMNDKYEYIEWWLYEGADRKVWEKDGSKEWNLQTPEALYDFLVEGSEEND